MTSKRTFIPPCTLRLRTMGSAILCWSLAALTLWVGAETVCPDKACRILKVDRQLLDVLHTIQHPALDMFFVAVTWLGSIFVLLPVTLALTWRLLQHGNTAAAAMLPLAVGGAWLLAHAGKWLVERPRPALHAPLASMPTDMSFPSAHTMQIAAFALAWMVAPGVQREWHSLLAATLLIVLVALSRLYLQVHFPSDVLFGLIATTGWVLGLRLLLGIRT